MTAPRIRLAALLRTVCIAAALLLCLPAAAQKHTQHVDPATLDYGTNLMVPEVPIKQVSAIRTHISSIRAALTRHGFETELNRDKEVLTVTIPCAELFAANDTVLKPAARQKLNEFLSFLRYPTMYKLVVAVYSDNTGEPEYCEALTSARANAVDEYLVALAADNGIADVNVIPYGIGQADPVVENNSIEHRARNRRVEIHIVPEWQMIETAKAGKLNR